MTLPSVDGITKIVEFFEEEGDTVWVNCPVEYVRFLLDEIQRLTRELDWVRDNA